MPRNAAPSTTTPGDATHRWWMNLIPLLFLGAIGLATLVVQIPPKWLVGLVLGGMLLLAVGWVLVSALWPAKADRKCPACELETVVRLDPDDVRGLTCTACGWRDETVSSWFLAEEEEPVLEDLVRSSRRSR